MQAPPPISPSLDTATIEDIEAAFAADRLRYIADAYDFDSPTGNFGHWAKRAAQRMITNRNRPRNLRAEANDRRNAIAAIKKLEKLLPKDGALSNRICDDFNDAYHETSIIGKHPWLLNAVSEKQRISIELGDFDRLCDFIDDLARLRIALERISGTKSVPGRKEDRGLFEGCAYLASFWEFELGRRFTVDHHAGTPLSKPMLFVKSTLELLAPCDDAPFVTACRKVAAEFATYDNRPKKSNDY